MKRKEVSAKDLKQSLITWLILYSGLCSWLMYSMNQIKRIFYDEMVAGFGVTNTELGIIYSVYNALCLLLYVPGGILCDRIRLKYLVPAAMLFNAVLLFILSTLPSYHVIIVIYLCFAVATALMFWATKFKLVKMSSTDANYSTNIGLSYGAWAVIGVILSAVLTAFFAKFDQPYGLKYTYILVGCITLVLAVVGFITIPRFEGEIVKKEDRKGSSLASMFEALKYPGVWLTGLTLFFSYILHSNTYLTSPYLTNVFGVSVVFVGIFGTIRSYGVNICSAPIMGFLGSKCKSTSRVICYSQSVVILGLLAFLFLPKNPSFAIVVAAIAIVWNFIIGGNFSVNSGILAEFKIPAHVFGAASGVFSLIGFISDSFLPAIVGNWLDTKGNGAYTYIFVMLIGASVMTAILAFISSRVAARQAARLAE